MGLDSSFHVLEFFAGAGMAHLGLNPHWNVIFANDYDEKKTDCYQSNFSSPSPLTRDVHSLSLNDLPTQFADLAWASFPCQDLSLAGARGGLQAQRSSAFFGFWNLMESLRGQYRAPHILVLENVKGLLTSHQGQDFTLLCHLLAKSGYRFGALELDAKAFVPQSRPRLFIIACRAAKPLPSSFLALGKRDHYGLTPAIHTARERLGASHGARWIDWHLPTPPARAVSLDQIIDPSLTWHSADQRQALLGLMNATHRQKVEAAHESARQTGKPQIGFIVRRTRQEQGKRQQRAEVRFDGVSGCLRTPGGGSSRQFVIWCEGERVETRPMAAREAARLMGLPDSFQLPTTTGAALHVIGDGLCVPVVSWLDTHLLSPLAQHLKASTETA